MRTPRPRRRRRRWRRSLYTRSALFLLLGSGCVLGAVGYLSSITVKDSVKRLLGERINVARTAGIFLEHRIRADLDRVAAQVRSALAKETGSGRPAAIRAALVHELADTVFADGAFIVDADGGLLAAVPADAAPATGDLDLAAQLSQARERAEIVSSPLVRNGRSPVLVLTRALRDREGRLLGYLCALLQPVVTDLLAPLSRTDGIGQVELDLIDRRGVVVASTDRRGLFRTGDHDQLLAGAIRTRTELRGRCHSCHVQEDGSDERATDVIAFAPLPTLALGLAVHQPEQEALAPAFALRDRMLFLGSAFVVLFLVFAGLSVRSVVRPVTRLTRAVREVEDGQEKLALPSFGGDEVGQLARALNLWRERLVDSLAAAEESRLLREAGLERERLRQQYLHRVLKAREDERRLVARELHDTVAQDLAALRLEIERLGDRAGAARDKEQLAELEARVQQMLATVRAILLDMRLSVLETMGCMPALEWQIERLEEQHGIRGTFVHDGPDGVCDYETAVTLFRILQEALLNVVLHAGAEQVFATLTTGGGAVELLVEDDGRGFVLEDVRRRRLENGERGFGLLGMEERARLLGGTLDLASTPGEGTTVHVVVPLPVERTCFGDPACEEKP